MIPATFSDKRVTEYLHGRRAFLRYAQCLAGLPFAGLAQTPAPGLIVREKEPQNLEFPFASLDSYLTPNELFYVRNHFQAPATDPATHRIRVEGAVDRPFEIGMDELRRLAQRRVTATLECAGNSRAFLVPKTGGVQWELGAVSNAEWTGVPLAALLEKAGVRADAVEVVLEGADRGEPRNDPKPPGGTPFARSIPLAKARKPEVLIAYAMNGKDLPANHGAPVRAVVPGCYGMSSVKWLTRIQVVKEPFRGYWQTTDYAWWDRSAGVAVRRPLMDMQVKSLIARPTAGEALKAGTRARIAGAAWTGDAEVTKVEVSSDGGATWTEARLMDKAVRFAWRRWEHNWEVPSRTGRHTLMARATDSQGNTQPLSHNRDMGNYVIRYIVPVEVEVT